MLVSFHLFKDFDILGEKMVSCGMDHSLKIWSLETDAMKKVIQPASPVSITCAAESFN